MVGNNPVFAVSDAVAVLNQSLEMLYPTITVVGELANYKVAKGKWLYADIKDEFSKLRVFGTIFQLPGPLEDGMMVEIVAQPRLHQQFGFSLNIQTIRPVGEGSLKKAAQLLQLKLEKEGLFAPERKRLLPFAPEKVGLIASMESAGYADFTKVMQARWSGVEVKVYDVTVQGERAPESIIAGLHYFNQQGQDVDILVVVRGGGSADDLQAFSDERVVRAVAASRIPTVVAIGHEVDVSLAELAADLRASTPSNAAELIFPDKKEEYRRLILRAKALDELLYSTIEHKKSTLSQHKETLVRTVQYVLDQKAEQLAHARSLLKSMHPSSSLKRGFALIQKNGKLVSSKKQLAVDEQFIVTLQDGDIVSRVESV